MLWSMKFWTYQKSMILCQKWWEVWDKTLHILIQIPRSQKLQKLFPIWDQLHGHLQEGLPCYLSRSMTSSWKEDKELDGSVLLQVSSYQMNTFLQLPSKMFFWCSSIITVKAVLAIHPWYSLSVQVYAAVAHCPIVQSACASRLRNSSTRKSIALKLQHQTHQNAAKIDYPFFLVLIHRKPPTCNRDCADL